MDPSYFTGSMNRDAEGSEWHARQVALSMDPPTLTGGGMDSAVALLGVWAQAIGWTHATNNKRNACLLLLTMQNFIAQDDIKIYFFTDASNSL
jgi:hypothetical protein